MRIIQIHEEQRVHIGLAPSKMKNTVRARAETQRVVGKQANGESKLNKHLSTQALPRTALKNN